MSKQGKSKAKAKRRTPTGRKTLLTREVHAAIVDALSLGYTQRQAAEGCGVAPKTISEWLNKGERGIQPYADFAADAQRARDRAPAELRRKLAEDFTGEYKALAEALKYTEVHRKRKDTEAKTAIEVRRARAEADRAELEVRLAQAKLAALEAVDADGLGGLLLLDDLASLLPAQLMAQVRKAAAAHGVAVVEEQRLAGDVDESMIAQASPTPIKADS